MNFQISLVYVDAVDSAFGLDVDYSQLVKHYGTSDGESTDDNESDKKGPRRYIGSEKKAFVGQPNMATTTTSHVERCNLTMRMGIKRFARRTNAFSKKLENHMHAISLHFMYYNFARIHKSLRVSPAMEAGITGHLWDLDDIVKMTDEYWRGNRTQ